MNNNYIMSKLFIDTETNGLPITKNYSYYNPKNTKYYDKSRIIDIAYIIYDENNVKVKEVTSLIKPDGFLIENTDIHGITFENAMNYGLNIKDILQEFYIDLCEYNVTTIISHNINFDINIILSECYRLKFNDLINTILKINKECTMNIGKNYMKSNKNPKLIVLYEFLFHKEIIQEHRALSDTKICLECYFKMTNV